MPDLLMFKKLLLTGGGATAVDGISATALVGGELCWACVSDMEHLYQMNATSGAAADGVNIIIPVVGTVGTKRWILQEIRRKGLVITAAEATGTPSGTTTYFDIAVAVPSNVKLLGAQLRVDTALTAGETWGAAYVGGSTTTLAAAGQAVAKNTKVTKIHVDEISSNTVNVRITRDAGNFTNGVGVIRAIVYYETFSAMGDAA